MKSSVAGSHPCPSCEDGRHGFHDSNRGSPAVSCACWCVNKAKQDTITVTLSVDVNSLGEGFAAWCPALGCRATAGTRLAAVSAIHELAEETLREQDAVAREERARRMAKARGED